MIRIVNLTKIFDKTKVLDDISLEIASQDIFGFIGPNGAGKTTLIRILATLLKATSGEVSIDGLDLLRQPNKVKRLIGYMPDFFGIYESLKVWEYLNFFAQCYKIPKERRTETIDRCLKLTNLEDRKEYYVETLSKGMKQRLCLAKTLINDPKVLLLDEPAGGLDPLARIELRILLKGLQKMGKTIFITSHILSEMQDVCNKIAIIKEGRLISDAEGNPIIRLGEYEKKEKVEVKIELLSSPAEVKDIIASLGYVEWLFSEDKNIVVRIKNEDEEQNRLLIDLVNAGVKVCSLSRFDTNLEEKYRQLIGEK